MSLHEVGTIIYANNAPTEEELAIEKNITIEEKMRSVKARTATFPYRTKAGLGFAPSDWPEVFPVPEEMAAAFMYYIGKTSTGDHRTRCQMCGQTFGHWDAYPCVPPILAHLNTNTHCWVAEQAGVLKSLLEVGVTEYRPLRSTRFPKLRKVHELRDENEESEDELNDKNLPSSLVKNSIAGHAAAKLRSNKAKEKAAEQGKELHLVHNSGRGLRHWLQATAENASLPGTLAEDHKKIESLVNNIKKCCVKSFEDKDAETFDGPQKPEDGYLFMLRRSWLRADAGCIACSLNREGHHARSCIIVKLLEVSRMLQQKKETTAELGGSNPVADTAGSAISNNYDGKDVLTDSNYFEDLETPQISWEARPYVRWYVRGAIRYVKGVASKRRLPEVSIPQFCTEKHMESEDEVEFEDDMNAIEPFDQIDDDRAHSLPKRPQRQRTSLEEFRQVALTEERENRRKRRDAEGGKTENILREAIPKKEGIRKIKKISRTTKPLKFKFYEVEAAKPSDGKAITVNQMIKDRGATHYRDRKAITDNQMIKDRGATHYRDRKAITDNQMIKDRGPTHHRDRESTIGSSVAISRSLQSQNPQASYANPMIPAYAPPYVYAPQPYSIPSHNQFVSPPQFQYLQVQTQMQQLQSHMFLQMQMNAQMQMQSQINAQMLPQTGIPLQFYQPPVNHYAPTFPGMGSPVQALPFSLIDHHEQKKEGPGGPPPYPAHSSGA